MKKLLLLILFFNFLAITDMLKFKHKNICSNMHIIYNSTMNFNKIYLHMVVLLILIKLVGCYY